MADGILKVGTITTSSGSGTITIGQSGETVDMANGTITLNSSMTNTPAFLAYQSSNQSISNNTTTTITFDTEVYDTNNAFASNTFTVPSGEGGKYFFSFAVRVNNNTQNRLYAELVDGGGNSRALFENGNGGAYDTAGGAVVLDLSASDTVVVKYYHNSGSTNTTFSGANDTFFGGYKLIT
tara:strand:- start:51 stop:593 length:543 start_codon:yes stop_codon:yes gene_type:complete